MPRVPVYERREEVGAAPRPNVSAAPDADAFGRAASQGLVKVVQAGAHELGEHALVEQQKVDKARTFDNYQKIGQWRQANIYDRETGFLSKQGEAALSDGKSGRPLAAVLLEDYDKFTAEIEGKAANENQRAAFVQMRAHERESISKELIGHERRQSDAVALQKFEAGQDTAVSNAANGYFDPTSNGLNNENLSMARAIGESGVLTRAKELGWPPEQTEAELRKFRTRFHMAVLDRMTDNEHASLAATYLDDNGHEIDGEIRAKSNIDKVIAAAGLKQRAQGEADRIAELSTTDFGKWVAEANKIQDVNLRDEVMQRLTQRYGLEEKARDEVEKQALGRVFQGILNTRYLDRTSKDFQSLRDDAKARAIDKLDSLTRQQRSDDAEARRQQQEYDRRALAYFETLDDKTKAGSTFTEQDHQVYDGISDVARYQLEARKNRAVKDIEQKQVANKADFDGLVQTATANLGKKEKEAVKNFMTDWRIRWYDEHDQKPPTRDEVRDIGLTEAVKTYIIPGLIWDSEKKAYQLSKEDREKYKAKDAPAAPTRVPAPKDLEDGASTEVIRYDPKTKRSAVYDGATKKFLRWQQ